MHKRLNGANTVIGLAPSTASTLRPQYFNIAADEILDLGRQWIQAHRMAQVPERMGWCVPTLRLTYILQTTDAIIYAFSSTRILKSGGMRLHPRP